MKYSKKKVGEELNNIIEIGYDIIQIANWAYDIYFFSRGDFSPEIGDVLEHLFLMEASPEFEYTKKELRLLALFLINEESNAIQKINQLKSLSPLEMEAKLNEMIGEISQIIVKKSQDYLRTPDLAITKHATEIDNNWIMCPDCIDAWESTSENAMVVCPKCNQTLQNPRYKPEDINNEKNEK